MTDNQKSSADQFDTWVQIATRYFVLSNAGGAVAVLSFLGTRSGSGRFGCFAVASLAWFVFGVIAAGFLIMTKVIGAYRTFLTPYIPEAVEASMKSWTTRPYDKFERYIGRVFNLAFGLFVLGSLIGLVGLGVALLSG
jgi:hypothetical protein